MTPLLYLQEARKNLVLRRGNKPTNPAEHGDGEADGEVCDVVGEDVGGVGDPDPALAALGEVDAVDADGEGGDDLERRERVDEHGCGRNSPAPPARTRRGCGRETGRMAARREVAGAEEGRRRSASSASVRAGESLFR